MEVARVVDRAAAAAGLAEVASKVVASLVAGQEDLVAMAGASVARLVATARAEATRED